MDPSFVRVLHNRLPAQGNRAVTAGGSFTLRARNMAARAPELRTLLGAIRAQSDPLTPHDERRRAHEVCEAFKRTPDSAESALMLLQGTQPATDDTVQHFAMHVLQLDIKYRWNTWVDATRRRMRESVLQVSAGQFQSKPRFLREMAARLLADIAQREFPQRWPDLMENMLALAGAGAEQAEIAWITLALLAEDCSDADFNGAMPAGRRREVMQGLHALYPTLHAAAFALLEDQYGVFNRAHAAGAALEVSRGSDVLSAVLRFIESCAVWAKWPVLGAGSSGAEHVAVTSAEDVGAGSFIFASATLMANAALPEACRRRAWACLRALLSSAKFTAYATLTATPSRCDSTTAARAAHVLCSVAPALRRTVAVLPLDPMEQSRWLEQAELLVVLSQYSHIEIVASAMNAPKPAVPLAAASSALQEVLQLALELTARHPSQLLLERLLAMWLALLRSGALRAFAEALLVALVPALLEALAGRLQLEGDPELSGEDGACSSCDWSAEHFADCAEWQIFWAQQLRPRLGLVLRLVARHHADAAAKFACNAAATALARVSAAGSARDACTAECGVVCALAMEIVGGIAPGSFNMVPVSGDGGGGNGSASPAAESKLKERERRSRLVSMLGELLQNLCRLASNAIVVSDATALGRLVQCVGLFGPLLQQQPSLLPPVLELLFGALTFGEPSGLFASAPSPAVAAARLRHSLSPRAQASRRSAGKTLLRLCSVPRFSAVMEPHFGAFCGRTGELIRAQRLLAIERQVLQEALVAVSLGMGTHEQRAGFLDQVLAPVLGEWTSTEISADVSSASALLKSMVTCRKRADAAVCVDTTVAASADAAGERLSPHWALLNALGSLLSIAKRTNAALLAGTSSSPVGLTSAHWSHIMPNAVQAIAALHSCWGDGSATAAAGVCRQVLLQERHARWLLGLSRDELMRLTGTESEAAAALLVATSGGSGGGGVSGFGDLATLGGSGRPGSAGARPKPGWGCWDDSGWDEGACAGDGVDGDELASWATRCRIALYSLLGQACWPPQPGQLGFLLSSTAAPALSQQPSQMLQQLHTVLITPLPSMEHRHVRLLLLNFFLPFVGAALRCDQHEVWCTAMAPLIAPLLVHMNERLRIAWAAIASCGAGRSGEGGSAALLAQGHTAWLPVLPTTNLGTAAARERLDRACERTLRELTRAYAQVLCAIFLPLANTASSPANASLPGAPPPSPELVPLLTGSARDGASKTGERLTLPLYLVQSREAPVVAMADPLCAAIAGLLGGDAWQCADSVAAARGAMLARQLLRLLGLGVAADISSAQTQAKTQTPVGVGVSERSAASEHPKIAQRLIPFLGQDLFLAALIPLLRRSPHVSGGSQNLQWEMLGLLKDIYVGLTVHMSADPSVCNMPRRVLMSVAHAAEAEIAALDSALQSSQKRSPTVRDKEQKHCMRDWLAQLVLKRESQLHAAGVDVEGAEAHAAATGAAAGDSVLRERPSVVQNLHEPLVIKSKENAKDASAWQSVAEDLGTGNLFGDADGDL